MKKNMYIKKLNLYSSNSFLRVLPAEKIKKRRLRGSGFLTFNKSP